jgi:hypothetical protein
MGKPSEKKKVFHKEIEDANGSMAVFDADSLEGLVEAIAEAKRAAVGQLNKVQAEKRELASKTNQELLTQFLAELEGSVLRAW